MVCQSFCENSLALFCKCWILVCARYRTKSDVDSNQIYMLLKSKKNPFDKFMLGLLHVFTYTSNTNVHAFAFSINLDAHSFTLSHSNAGCSLIYGIIFFLFRFGVNLFFSLRSDSICVRCLQPANMRWNDKNSGKKLTKNEGEKHLMEIFDEMLKYCNLYQADGFISSFINDNKMHLNVSKECRINAIHKKRVMDAFNAMILI